MDTGGPVTVVVTIGAVYVANASEFEIVVLSLDDTEDIVVIRVAVTTEEDCTDRIVSLADCVDSRVEVMVFELRDVVDKVDRVFTTRVVSVLVREMVVTPKLVVVDSAKVVEIAADEVEVVELAIASVWTADVGVRRDIVVEGESAIGDDFTPGTPEQMLMRASPKAARCQARDSMQT